MALQFENELVVPGSYEKFVTEVDDAILHGPSQARASLNFALSVFTPDGDTTISAECERKGLSTIGSDKNFILENSFLSGMEGAQGEAVLRANVLAALPSKAGLDDTFTIENIIINIQACARSSLCKFVSISAKGHMDTICDLVCSIKSKSPPLFALGKVSPLVQEAIDRLTFFASVSPCGREELQQEVCSRGFTGSL